jgi:WD40 repeat protein
MRGQTLLVLTCVGMLAGCGGEDFSQPPAAIRERQAAAKAAAEKAAAEGGGSSAANSSPVTDPAAGTTAEAAGSQNAQSVPSDTPTAAVSSASNTPPGDAPVAPAAAPTLAATSSSSSPAPADGSLAGPPAPRDTADSPGSDTTGSNPANEPAAANAGDVVTASGKTAEDIADRREANSQKSTIENGRGLLDSLRASDSSEVDSSGDGASMDSESGVVARFGRMALTPVQWTQLVTQLTKRFFVAATPDGLNLAASSGERSAGVLSPPLSAATGPGVAGEAVGVGSIGRMEPTLRPVTSLPGLISAVEMLPDGDQLLCGTTDGRLLVRTTADRRDWDLFARDQFLFLDEHRRTARLSDQPIVVIRCLPDGRILTVDGNGDCCLWNQSDVVLPPTSIAELTPEQVQRPEPETVSAAPQQRIRIAGYRVLSVSVSEDGLLACVITSEEDVTIIDLATGTKLCGLTGADFADTQPVCAIFVPGRREVLAGLADGRIIRRAFADGEAVSGTDDRGGPVDYEAVWIPDTNDQRGSITALGLSPSRTSLYFGSLDGSVGRYDLIHKQLDYSTKRHTAPVLEFRFTSVGVMSLGADRKAHLFDRPDDPARLTSLTWQLPQDESLAESDSAADATADSGTGSKSARPKGRRSGEVRVGDAIEAQADLSLVGLRPSDATLALRQHQLRVSATGAERLPAAQRLLEHQGRNSEAAALATEPGPPVAGPPLQAGEITTEFAFRTSEWQPVLLSIADDGRTVSAVRRRRESVTLPARGDGVCVWDVPTATMLRCWLQPGAILNLQATPQERYLLSGIPIAGLSLSDGVFRRDDLRPTVAMAVEPSLQDVLLARIGAPGLSVPGLLRGAPGGELQPAGPELFEACVTAVAISPSSAFISLRERDQTRLLELDRATLQTRAELNKEKLQGSLVERVAITADMFDRAGAVVLVPFPSDKGLVAWGEFENGPELRIWRRKGDRWPVEEVTVFSGSETALDLVSCRQPLAFVAQQDTRLAVVTKQNLVLINVRKGEVERVVPIPEVNGHRPVCAFSPDHQFLILGDHEGQLWAQPLSSLDAKPLKFAAHTGPICGLAFSPNGRWMATVGEENRLRVWRVDGFLQGKSAAGKANTAARAE